MRVSARSWGRPVAVVGVLTLGTTGHGQPPSGEDFQQRAARMSREADRRGLAEPFRGVTTDGTVVQGLFPVRSTGVSTEPVRAAAAAFLAALTAEQRRRTQFGAEDDEWRKWMNQHFYRRQGVSFKEMTEAQKDGALGLLRASLSARGLVLTRDIMRLNTTLAELNGGNFEEYGEGFYYLTVMGEPSAKEPWGWQLDGHHLIVNYFVLGDQVVMTPSFFGSEPAIAHAGRYKGTAVLQEEQAMGLALRRSLDAGQSAKAVLGTEKTANQNQTEAWKDNAVVPPAGLSVREMTASQRKQVEALIERYVGNLDDGHARVKMEEVRRHLDDTRFAWVGAAEDDSVFYYRIQSPVILIEFDHQVPVGMRRIADPSKPFREHIHTVVRTPNGNDYGKDLLRQHLETHPHPHSH
jgi:hypothetical protein